MLEDDLHVGGLEWHVQRPVGGLVPGPVRVVQPGGDDFRGRDVIDIGAKTGKGFVLQKKSWLFERKKAGKKWVMVGQNLFVKLWEFSLLWQFGFFLFVHLGTSSVYFRAALPGWEINFSARTGRIFSGWCRWHERMFALSKWLGSGCFFDTGGPFFRWVV